ncbi:MAG: DUF1998 domain-containing protein [Desulfococcaceae bacterium]|jgi:hypothetical protein|nr:DUF1998 domain-containing protein [Desulfococcaceae bacterium]
MAENRLGELRRSAVVMTYGPGSVVDFRADNAPVSAVTAGLEEWDNSFPPRGLLNHQKISEPRLQRKMGVKGFRLPPVVYEEKWKKEDNPDSRSLVAARFPGWLQCPQCNRLSPAGNWRDEPGRAYRYCAKCTSNAPGQRKIFAVPVRFIMACPKGHLDDFPWHFWVNHKPDCPKKQETHLFLKSERPGLSGLILRCPECDASKSMDGIFSAETWRGFPCRGRRPWLAGQNETCDSQPRALQRGASNLYFPVLASALSIPPWSDILQEALGIYWNPIVEVKPEDRATFIRILGISDLKPVLDELGLSPEELSERIEERMAIFNDDAILDIRQEEYRQFVSGTDTSRREDREFEIRNVQIPDRLAPYFKNIVRVVRLREVRAIKGFTRINPPENEDSPDIAPLSVKPTDWLPAIEVRGEGIFLAFQPEAVRNWEEQESVIERARKVNEKWLYAWRQRYSDKEAERQITARFLLVHTFAHALIRQLTLECGYSTAALRERLYVSEDQGGKDGMAGLLIYTATSDSDGTLGGLQRQGKTARIERAVIAAIRSMEWCSSDPLCIEGMMAGADGLSLAACHACVLAPETACEEYNRFLDRALLIGTPSNPETGFFPLLLRSK